MGRKYFIPLLVSIVLINCYAQVKENTGIDTTQTIVADILNSGNADSILLNITGATWDKPVRWRIDVRSNEKTIYSYSQYDTLIDEFFTNPKYVGGCTDYINCKKKYYLHTMLKNLVHTFSCSKDPNRICSNSINIVTKRFYIDSMKLNKNDAVKSVRNLHKQLQTQQNILVIPDSPVMNLFEMVYDKGNMRFVPIHE